MNVVIPNYPSRGQLLRIPMQVAGSTETVVTGNLPSSLTDFQEATHKFELTGPPYATLRLIGARMELVVSGVFLRPLYSLTELFVAGRPQALYAPQVRLVPTSGWAYYTPSNPPGVWVVGTGSDTTNVIGLRDKSLLEPTGKVEATVKVENQRLITSLQPSPPGCNYMLALSLYFDVVRDRYVEGNLLVDYLRGYYGRDVNLLQRVLPLLQLNEEDLP